ncbi:MAG: hypothetical protein IT337_12415 [Thermomicrobiales bacterium]|nr:hypothetical protein [Thermomicrobiales bacterium]
MAKPPHEMTGQQLGRALDRLGISVYAAAPLLGMSRRQAYRLTAGESPVPALVAKVVRLLAAGRITLQDLE